MQGLQKKRGKEYGWPGHMRSLKAIGYCQHKQKEDLLLWIRVVVDGESAALKVIYIYLHFQSHHWQLDPLLIGPD